MDFCKNECCMYTIIIIANNLCLCTIIGYNYNYNYNRSALILLLIVGVIHSVYIITCTDSKRVMRLCACAVHSLACHFGNNNFQLCIKRPALRATLSWNLVLYIHWN